MEGGILKKYTSEYVARRVKDARSRNESEWYDSDYDKKLERRSYYIPHPHPPPIKYNYPYFGTAGDELLTFIVGIIEDRMTSYGDTKAEVAQEVALAILSGHISREQFSADPDYFIGKKFRKFAIGLNHCIVSLDALLDEDGEVTMHDVFSIKENMSELAGGINYETRGTRFERGEQWDGEVCARY